MSLVMMDTSMTKILGPKLDLGTNRYVRLMIVVYVNDEVKFSGRTN